MTRILVLEDDAGLAAGLRFDLEAEGYRVSLAPSLEKARQLLAEQVFDLALLDVMLPDGTGYDICREIREAGDMPVLFLTANDMERDEALAFDLGADDYITKPFSMALLRRRVAAVLARSQAAAPAEGYNDGFLQVDLARMRLTKGGTQEVLTATEAKLLRVFLQNPGTVLERDTLLARLWDDEGNFVDAHALTVNIGRLRAKLESEGHNYIKTVYGVGYQWTGGKA